MIYEILGKISFVIIISLFLLFAVSLALGFLLVKKNRLVLPKVLLFTIDTFYLQVKRIAHTFGISERTIDQIGIEIRNSINIDRFSSIDGKDRILVVPQCLRHIKCPARLDPTVGVACKECGMCVIKDLKYHSEELGYKFYIVPGGSFVERIVKAVKPKAALGVACYKDLNSAMHGISRSKCIVQGIPLIKDGCINTEVDIRELIKRMEMGIKKSVEDASKGCSNDRPQPS